MPRARRDVENALVSRGFVEGPGDHHFLVYYTKDGKKSIARTKTNTTDTSSTLPPISLLMYPRLFSSHEIAAGTNNSEGRPGLPRPS